MERLADYVEGHLVDYIQQEVDHGYSIEHIREVLLNYHHHNIVEAAMQRLKSQGFKVRKRRVTSNQKLDQRLFEETVNMLQDYIVRQKQRGYKTHHIKEALLNFGHYEQTVRSAIEAVEYGKEPVFVQPFDYDKVRTYLFPVGLVSFFLFALWLAASVNESPVRIISLFFPTLVTIFLCRGFYPVVRQKQTILAFPLVLSVLYYVLGATGQSVFQDSQLMNLTVLNVLFAFPYTFFYMGQPPEVVETERQDLMEGLVETEPQVLEEEFGVRELTPQEREALIEAKIQEEQERLKPVKLEVKKVKDL